MSNQFAWWQRGVVYQIYPRSFMDSNGDGIGDLQGIISRLDYLVDLGVDAIWLSPFYRSPMKDFGYDVADYTDVDPMFGNLDDFDQLVTAVHERGMKLIVDYVPNHSSDQHAWFKESRSSRDNPKRDWYIWRDAKPDGSPPNNWGSMFGGPAWTWDDNTRQYYFHQFAPEQPDLNWRNPDVRAAMMDVLRFWMQRGVDGFRMDVVYVVWKHPDMPDQPLQAGVAGRGEDDRFAQQQQIYAFNYDGVQNVMAEIRTTLDEFGAISIAEVWLSLAERLPYYQNFEMPFNFDFIGEIERYQWDADFFRRGVEKMEATLSADQWPNYVLGNHDIPRLASRYGSDERARCAALLLLTLRGTPTLYMGDEIGMVNGDISEDQIQDPQGKILGVAHTRDVTRTPIQWDDSAHAGFSKAEPWLPINADYRTRNIAAQQADSQSIWTLYQRLLAYRHDHGSLAVGSYQTADSPADVYAYLRQHESETHLIAINFGGESHAVPLPRTGEIVLSTGLDREGHVSDAIMLAPDEGLLVRLS